MSCPHTKRTKTPEGWRCDACGDVVPDLTAEWGLKSGMCPLCGTPTLVGHPASRRCTKCGRTFHHLLHLPENHR